MLGNVNREYMVKKIYLIFAHLGSSWVIKMARFEKDLKVFTGLSVLSVLFMYPRMNNP